MQWCYAKEFVTWINKMNNYYFSFQEQYFLIPMHEDKVVESKTEKSKHL